jgi:putative polyketide hydroxylase
MNVRRTPVLIIGAGLAGLSAALLLAWRGVPSLLVEKRASTSRHPRARGVNMRSMELLRVVPGLEEELCSASRGELVIIEAETVASAPRKVIVPRGGFDTSSLTPAAMATAGQDVVEAILLRRVRNLGAEARFSTELKRLSQGESGVTATLRDLATGEDETVVADYLIGADGNRSMIRQALGIGTQGPGAFSQNLSILFESDFAPPQGERPYLCHLRSADFAGVFAATDNPRVAQVAFEYDPTSQSPADFDDRRCIEIVRAALGVRDVAVRVLDVTPWEMSSRLAAAMSKGRVFLAGDAAHTMPPTGGLGGQTAIQDAADLAWKLALVLQGQAAPALLETYHVERHPVAAMTVARQTASYVERMRPDRKDLADPNAELDYLSVAMGYIYRSAGVTGETPDDGAKAVSPLKASGRPGSRLAHVPLIRDNRAISTLDLVGRGFALLAAPGARAWVDAARQLKERAGAPIEAYRIDGDVIDFNELFLQRTGLENDGAILARPDGFIAWRARSAALGCEDALAAALGRALCRRLDLKERAA